MSNKIKAWLVDGEVYLYDEIDGEELDAIPLYQHPPKELSNERLKVALIEWAKNYWGDKYEEATPEQYEILFSMSRAIRSAT